MRYRKSPHSAIVKLSLEKIDAVRGVLYLRSYIKFCRFFLQPSSDLDNVRYTEWAQKFELIFLKIVAVKTLIYFGASMSTYSYFL